MENRFEVVRATFGSIGEDISEFAKAAQTFVSGYHVTVIKRKMGVSGKYVLYPAARKEDVSKLMPLQKKAGHIINDLRHILDQACHAASMEIGTSSPDKTNFPMAQNDVGLEGQLASKTGGSSGVPEVLHAEIRSFAPFWRYQDGREGDIFLRRLSQICNEHKHRIPLGLSYAESDIELSTNEYVSAQINPPNGRLQAGRTEIHVTPFGPLARLDVQFIPKITVINGGAFAANHLPDVFEYLYQKVGEIIDRLEAVARSSKKR